MFLIHSFFLLLLPSTPFSVLPLLAVSPSFASCVSHLSLPAPFSSERASRLINISGRIVRRRVVRFMALVAVSHRCGMRLAATGRGGSGDQKVQPVKTSVASEARGELGRWLRRENALQHLPQGLSPAVDGKGWRFRRSARFGVNPASVWITGGSC